jgi:hypothetical protein
MGKSTEGKTVKVRLSPEQVKRLEQHANRIGFNGLSTVLRALAFENLALREAQFAEEVHRKREASALLKRQLGGGDS